MNDGSRKLTHIAECLGLDGEGHYRLHMLYEFVQSGVDAATGRVLGQLRATGQKPTFAGEIAGRGLALPAELDG